MLRVRRGVRLPAVALQQATLRGGSGSREAAPATALASSHAAGGCHRPHSQALWPAGHYTRCLSTFVGHYAESRAALDYQYHTAWPPERQVMQDAIIAECLRQGSSSAAPWLVFSAGPMGAGKTHTFRSLAARSIFPLHKFVHIDPDRIRTRLPEMPTLIAANRALAASATHKEATFISEVVENEALRRGRNVLVDGTLKDAEWYRQRFAFLRRHYPQYRIAVVLVSASRAKVFERAARRALVTGREVPPEVLDDALARAPASFRALAPLADYAAEIDNDNDERGPVFVAPATAASFAAVWGLTGAAAAAANGAGAGAGESSPAPASSSSSSPPSAGGVLGSAPSQAFPRGSPAAGSEGRETVAEYRQRLWAAEGFGGYGGSSLGVLGLLSSANRSIGAVGSPAIAPLFALNGFGTSGGAAACIGSDHDNAPAAGDTEAGSWDTLAAAADVDDPLAEPLVAAGGSAVAGQPFSRAAALARDEELAAAYDGPPTAKQR